MAKPVLLAIDDDISVLEAVVQDLRRKYGQTYRILRAASGQAAIDISTQLKERGDVVALFLSDQRMPGMTGVEFLVRAIDLFPRPSAACSPPTPTLKPRSRRSTPPASTTTSTSPGIRRKTSSTPSSTTSSRPGTEGYKAPYDGIQVISTRWGAGDHEVRNFLSRNRIPFKWLNPEQTPEFAEMLRGKGLDEAKLPVVLFGDGSSLVQPTSTEIAGRVGLRTEAQQEYYDVVVVGAGPAGLAAGVYGASEGLKTLLVEPLAPGGQAGSSSKIENYLGFRKASPATSSPSAPTSRPSASAPSSSPRASPPSAPTTATTSSR